MVSLFLKIEHDISRLSRIPLGAIKHKSNAQAHLPQQNTTDVKTLHVITVNGRTIKFSEMALRAEKWLDVENDDIKEVRIIGELL